MLTYVLQFFSRFRSSHLGLTYKAGYTDIACAIPRSQVHWTQVQRLFDTNIVNIDVQIDD
jgi:hypothetical protein